MVCVARSSSSRVLAVEPGAAACAAALGRQLDRRQRVLDLVRQPARHLAPGRAALRGQQRRDVLEHDHQAAVASLVVRQRRAGPQQHAVAGLALAAPAARATRARPAGEPRAQRGDEAPQPGCRRRAASASAWPDQRGAARSPRIAPAAGLALRSCSCASMTSTPLDRRERITARRSRSLLDRLAAQRGLLAGAPQALGHVVERMHQEAHLVARGQRQPRAEVALADRARAGDQVLHRPRQPLRRRRSRRRPPPASSSAAPASASA